MLLVVAATVVLVFSKACFIILTPNILDESETGLDKSTTGADTGGREAAVAWRSAVMTIKHSGDQSFDSWVLTTVILALVEIEKGLKVKVYPISKQDGKNNNDTVSYVARR